MKVSFIDDEPEMYPLQYGGKARTILALAKSALQSEEIDEVTVLSRSINDPRDSFSDYGGVAFEKLSDHTMISRITDEAETADILSVHTCSFTFPRLPAGRRKAALVYHLHDVMLTTADKGSHLDKALAGDWDVIVSPSAFATRTYHNFAALTGNTTEVRTIPRGIDHTLFHAVPKTEAMNALKQLGVDIRDANGPVIFFPSRADVGKGDDYIGRICESLADEYEDYMVITTSDTTTQKPHPNVTHIGWQHSSRLKYLYSIADVTLSLSKLPESFSQVCIESVACGTPVLAFPFGNLAGLSESLPAVVNCEPNTEAVIAGISRLLTEPEVHTAVQQSQSVIQEKYSLDTIGKTYTQLYLDIARNRQKVLRNPPQYFVSPFAAVHSGKAYVSNNEGTPLVSHALNDHEAAVLASCTAASSEEEIALTTGLSRATIRPILETLMTSKVIIGG